MKLKLPYYPVCQSGVFRGVVFAGGITPDLNAPSVTPDFTVPP